MTDDFDFGLGGATDGVPSLLDDVGSALFDGAAIGLGFGRPRYGYGMGYGYGGWNYGGGRSTGFLAAFIGLALLLASIWLVHWNEKQLADQTHLISRQLKTLVELDSNTTVTEPTDQIIHISGMAESVDTPIDPLLNAWVPHALSLKRTVEMYQWKEKVTHRKRKVGSLNTGDTTATYEKVWSETPIDSTHFEYTGGHENPAGFPSLPIAAAGTATPLLSQRFDAAQPHLGVYWLGPEIFSQMTNFTHVMLDSASPVQGFSLDDNGDYYHGSDSHNPAIGDTRVRIQAVMPQTYSVIGTMGNNTLTGYHNGFNLALAVPGDVPAQQMLHTGKYRPQVQVWLIRGACFAMIFLAFMLMASPIEALVSWIPFVGGLVEMGIFLGALTLAVPVTATAIALAWAGQRPVMAVCIFAVGGGLGAILWWRHLGIARHDAQVKAYMAHKQGQDAPTQDQHHSPNEAFPSW